MEGGMFPSSITCADAGMASPELDWTAGPSGTMSYGVTLTDLTNTYIHWAIWNIPVPSGNPTTITLPANLATTAMLTTPMGATQTNRFSGKGYYGPCPSGMTHTYQFQVYALPTASLAGMTTSTDTASASMRAVATATGTLTGTSNATR
jgi:Raf kinase inhibitor-like YbhB/YbcL family protein